MHRRPRASGNGLLAVVAAIVAALVLVAVFAHGPSPSAMPEAVATATPMPTPVPVISKPTRVAYSPPARPRCHGSRVEREQCYARRVGHLDRAEARCLAWLWDRESGWNPWAVNPTSGAAGIPQALGHGDVFRLGDWRAQIRWGLGYIRSAYVTPCGAWAHETSRGWY